MQAVKAVLTGWWFAQLQVVFFFLTCPPSNAATCGATAFPLSIQKSLLTRVFGRPRSTSWSDLEEKTEIYYSSFPADNVDENSLVVVDTPRTWDVDVVAGPRLLLSLVYSSYLPQALGFSHTPTSSQPTQGKVSSSALVACPGGSPVPASCLAILCAKPALVAAKVSHEPAFDHYSLDLGVFPTVQPS